MGSGAGLSCSYSLCSMFRSIAIWSYWYDCVFVPEVVDSDGRVEGGIFMSNIII